MIARQINVRVTVAELVAIDAAAKAGGVTRSEWIRLVLRHAAGAGELARQLGRVDPERGAT